jgi:hypothetical protein
VAAADPGDALHDALALVEAVASGDTEGFGAVVRNCDSGTVVILAKLLAELLSDGAVGHGCCIECFREWAELAVERP